MRKGSKLFPGWYIVGAGFLTNLMVIGTTIFGISAFVVPMTTQLGWSKTAFAGAHSVASLLRAVVDPVLGPFVDRHGARRFIIVGATMLGLGFIGLSMVTKLWQYYLIWGVLVMVGTTSAGSWVVSVAISNWFVRKRGMLIAVVAIGSTLGMATLVPLSGFLIEGIGWRWTWVVLACLVWAIVIPPAVFFIKRRPEDIGLCPDGDPPGAVPGPGSLPGIAAAPQEARWTRREAIRTRAFWMILVFSTLFTLASQGIGFHFIPFLIEDKGMSVGAAVSLVGVMGLWSTATRLIWGLVIQRFGPKIVLTAGGILASVGLVLTVQFHSFSMILVGMALRNLGASGYLPGLDTIWPENFGRLGLGAVRSLASPFVVIMGAVGPLFPGILNDALGSYTVAFTISASVYMAAALLVLFVQRPDHAGVAMASAQPEGARTA